MDHIKNSIYLLDDPDRYLTTDSLDKATRDLTKTIIEYYERVCPLVNPKPSNRKSLWSDELDVLKKAARKAWNRTRRKGGTREWEEYRAKQKEYKNGQVELEEKKETKLLRRS